MESSYDYSVAHEQKAIMNYVLSQTGPHAYSNIKDDYMKKLFEKRVPNLLEEMVKY